MFLESEYKKYLDGLTAGQSVAFHKILEWYFNYYNTDIESRRDNQVFVLSGYAGVGKTYLMGVLDKFMREHYNNDRSLQACAYTGKAATVLSEKGINATTLHHLLYIPLVSTYLDQETDKLTKYVKWRRRSFLEADIKLIVVDEASMLPQKLFEDLKLFNLPILCTGDGFQLPSIDMGTNLLDKPDYTLTEITRQAMDNSIIRLSMLVRNGEEIPYGDYGDNVQVVSKRNLYSNDYIEIMSNYDQLLVGTNKSKLYYNTLYRQELLGEHYDSNPLPCETEKVIITQNNWDFEIDPDGEYNLFNGLVGEVVDVETTNMPELDKLKLKINFGNKEFVTDWIVYDTGIFREPLQHAERFPYFEGDQTLLVDDKGNYLVKKNQHEINDMTPEQQKEYVNILYNAEDSGLKINQLDFGYAITVHKFQGSEADNICLIDESYIFGREDEEHKNRWLYTGITRAKKFLLLIK